MEEVVQKAAAAKSKENTANEVINTLSSKAAQLEVERDEAVMKLRDLIVETAELRSLKQAAEVEARAAEEQLNQLKAQVSHSPAEPQCWRLRY